MYDMSMIFILFCFGLLSHKTKYQWSKWTLWNCQCNIDLKRLTLSKHVLNRCWCHPAKMLILCTTLELRMCVQWYLEWLLWHILSNNSLSSFIKFKFAQIKFICACKNFIFIWPPRHVKKPFITPLLVQVKIVWPPYISPGPPPS